MTDIADVEVRYSEDPEDLKVAAEALLEIDPPEVPLVGPKEITLVSGAPAEVRELTGYDEEEIIRFGIDKPLNQRVNLAVRLGTNHIGGEEVTDEDVLLLPVGDRNTLYLNIWSLTLGPDLVVNDFQCPHCESMLDVTLDPLEDVPYTEWYEPLMLELRNGDIAKTCHRSVDVENNLISMPVEDLDQITTVMLIEQVCEVNGMPVEDAAEYFRSLGIKDRNKLSEAITSMNIGHHDGTFTFDCGYCGKEISSPIGVDSFLL